METMKLHDAAPTFSSTCALALPATCGQLGSIMPTCFKIFYELIVIYKHWPVNTCHFRQQLFNCSQEHFSTCASISAHSDSECRYWFLADSCYSLIVSDSME